MAWDVKCIVILGVVLYLVCAVLCRLYRLYVRVIALHCIAVQYMANMINFDAFQRV